MGEGSFLERTWAKFMDKLGTIASFVPAIAEQIKFAIKEDDAVKAEAHLQELDEFADAVKGFVATGRQAIADGNFDLIEGSETALALEKVIDEADDVVKGRSD